jgi:excisionase family DNA binding protein
MAQGMEKGGGAGSMATEMAVGLSIAQQMIQQQGLGTQAAAATPAAPAAAAPELLAPADVAKILGVTEQDVLSIIESGELTAKKIGAAYRIKRSSLDEYLAK